MSLELQRAKSIANKIVYALMPLCDRLEIAGSIRRGRPWVNDIDLVALPKHGQAENFRERCKRNSRTIADGSQNLIVELFGPPSFQLDIFIAHHPSTDMFAPQPSNYATLLLCRTGSKEHNIWLASRAKARGFHWNPYQGLAKRVGLATHPVETLTEAALYEALGLPYIEPANREQTWLNSLAFQTSV